MGMNFLTLTLAFVFCYVIRYFYNFYKMKSKFVKHGIPFIKPYPIFGNLLDFVFRTKAFTTIEAEVYNLCPEAKYAVIFQFGKPVIMLRDLDLIKNVAVKNADSFTNHEGVVDVENDEFFGNNLFHFKDEKWQKVRTTLTPAFTSSKMKIMFEVMSENAKSFSDSMVKLVENGGREFEMKDVLSRYGSDVNASSLLGIKIDSMQDPENEFYLLGKKLMDFEGILSVKLILSTYFPWIMKLLNMRLFTDRIQHFFVYIIKETIKIRDKKNIFRPDVLNLMMKTRGTPSMLTLEEMTGLIFGFFLSGFDTVVTQMSFIVHEIAVNPKIHSTLQKEIDSIWFETKGNLTYDIMNKLPYLDAVVNESLRLYPQGSMSDRICNKSFILPPTLPGALEYTINPGEMITIPLGPIMKDSQNFENPEKFDPDRFLERKIISNQLPFIPFGVGPRMCIGYRFAFLEMKILLIHLLLRCNLTVCSRTNVPMKFSKKNLFLSAEGGWWLKIDKRTNSPIDRLERTL